MTTMTRDRARHAAEAAEARIEAAWGAAGLPWDGETRRRFGLDRAAARAARLEARWALGLQDGRTDMAALAEARAWTALADRLADRWGVRS